MAAKTLFVLCASTLLVQSISAQFLGVAPSIFNYGAGGCGCGFGPAAPVASTSGGGLFVTSSSPIAPSGISVVSENAIEGLVDVGGQLPVLAAVGLEGQLPTAGAAGTTYGCGNGNVGIAGESLAAAGYGASGLAGAGLGLANAGLINAGLANAGRFGYNGITGCGCAI